MFFELLFISDLINDKCGFHYGTPINGCLRRPEQQKDTVLQAVQVKVANECLLLIKTT